MTHKTRKTFKVTGYALIPVKIEMEVTAVNAEAAKNVAAYLFKVSPRKTECIVPNSGDESAVHGFEPSLVEESSSAAC